MPKNRLLLTALFFYAAQFIPAQARLQEPTVKYISPNNDGIQDNLFVNFTIKEKRYITEWHLYIEDAYGYPVRTLHNKDERQRSVNFAEFWRILFRAKRGVTVPRSVVWDGCDERGYVVPDGIYTYYLTAKNDNGLAGVSERRTVIVDCTPPEIILLQPQEADKFFGAGSKSELRIAQRAGTGVMNTDRWTGIIANAQGQICRIFEWQGSPGELRWYGEDDGGFPVPDGLYYYSVSGVDLAGNRGIPVRVSNIVYSGDKPALNITISGSRYFSNNPESPQRTITLIPSIPTPQSGNLLKEWKIEIIDASGKGKPVRSWPPSLADNRIPRSIALDGTDGAGHPLADGAYIARLSASYLNGYVPPPSYSPQFFLKSTPPAGSVSVREPRNRVFAPGSGTGRDNIIFEESLEPARWRAEILNADRQIVRVFERGGSEGRAPLPNVWDGFDTAGKLCADGDYLYSVSTVDLAGNPSRITPVRFTIDTRQTELVLYAAPEAFSPNGDGIQDTMTITPMLKSSGIVGYRFDITGSDGRIVKTESVSGALPPARFVWDGKDGAGTLVPDGRYSAALFVVSRNSDRVISASTRAFLLKANGPRALVNAEAYMPVKEKDGTAYQPIFSPDGDGRKDTIHIEIQTTAEDEWNAEITGADGKPVWRRSWRNTNVPSFNWDGSDSSGNIVPDGKYTFTLNAADAAGNSIRASTKPIIVDRRPVSASLTLSSDYLAPKGRDKVQRWAVQAPVKDGIQSWTFEVYPNTSGRRTPVKTFFGNGDTLPSQFEWDGKIDGAISEGEYAGTLNIIYWKGNVAAAQSSAFLCTGLPPDAAVSTSPKYFSPDNDGVDDELKIALSAGSILPLSSWKFTIYDYAPGGGRGSPFWVMNGGSAGGSQFKDGKMNVSSVWNGRSNTAPSGTAAAAKQGELVQSATDYPYTFTVTDIEGQTTTVEGQITVDILVIRDGQFLRIQVPAITFFPDTADFNGLAPHVLERNNWVLGRIARALNRFKEYTALVEGHANPVLGTKEEEAELLSLSAARAAFVKQRLSRLGINAARLNTIGVGAARPIPGVSPR
ncbi:MAG: OmpA family protein, partial [Spirochaetaceae bacterium]|nr:OmpA family protein [Spirochaetaceae bacterium]